jgi:uncharacterized Zn-binding protein involved in type VI secretion
VGKPAARIGDEHECPMAEPNGTPHVGGPIVGSGCVSVLIEGKPAATTGDACICAGRPDTITGGSTGVFIGGKPAARDGDSCEHGGVVIGGSVTVLIGESMGRYFMLTSYVWQKDEDYDEPSKEEKIGIVKQAIAECIALLENRLPLLVQDDAETKDRFVKWLGPYTEERKAVIVGRMERQLAFFKDLNLEMFDKIPNEGEYRKTFAHVYPPDDTFRIFLGNPFWNSNYKKYGSRVDILTHETSHFECIGFTKDHAYFHVQCNELVVKKPHKALYNADSYVYFLNA